MASTTSKAPPRVRVTLRQLIGTMVALGLVNALGASMSRPLADEGPIVRAEGLKYFASADDEAARARIDQQRVEVLRVVTVIVGNGFVLSVLGFWVGISYLEERRRYQLGLEHSQRDEDQPETPTRPSTLDRNL